MVSSLCFSPVFLPSLGDPDEPSPTASEDASTLSLFDGLMADPRFEELRRWFPDGSAEEETPIEFTTPGLGNHPVATVLSDILGDESDAESTMIIPVVDLPTDELPVVTRESDAENHDLELWHPDIRTPAYPRRHA